MGIAIGVVQNSVEHDSFYDSNHGAIASNALALPVVATPTLRKNWI